MLVDIDTDHYNSRSQEVREFALAGHKRMSLGVYHGGPNALRFLPSEVIKSPFPFEDDARRFIAAGGPLDEAFIFSSYGLADSIEQVLYKMPVLIESERKYVVTYFIQDARDDEFNAHKWGEYIGDMAHPEKYVVWRVTEFV